MYPPLMQSEVDAVFYYVTDLDRSVRSYGEVLGMKLKSRDFVARFDIDQRAVRDGSGEARGRRGQRAALPGGR